jgi:two-component sensor histidine kinase
MCDAAQPCGSVRSGAIGTFATCRLLSEMSVERGIEPSAAQAIAVTLHELATNAAKYGALSTPNGQVCLEWSQAADGQLCLRWIETGGPAVQEPTRKGVGGRIIEQMIAQQNGKVRLDWRKDGLICEIALRVW